MDGLQSQPRLQRRMQRTPDRLPGLRSRSRPRGEASERRRAPERRFDRERTWSPLRERNGQLILMEVRGHLLLKRPPPMSSAPKPHNARKYCEFHEQNRHTTAECRKLRKPLHELANKGQIDQFLKRGPRFLRKERQPARPEARDEECSTNIVATIAGGYAESITQFA
ncbi:hypothetical protein Cgig2_018038 [Carnegiea gigantea]|uniref:Reverse transcriptase domain-containing protein n=1 Tax=Carnegiea gigantea TaxID=171969 RepID=A0A9Q1JYL3_9CARY|nr:hypothetical protein Cgig2_018038 [Carnegiea gigantea]